MGYKIYLLLVFSCLSFITQAQTGIGTTTPDASAKLEVSATNKGFLPPRVALTATNVASPITNPANGLMVFNTVTAGTNPFQVVPGYYYWDATGLKWMSLSTTVGNVQNQAIYRSTSNTAAGSAVSTWNSRFNNIASGDLTVTSNTTFALSNGIYKIQWGLPHQQTQTYNTIQLQENTSGTWNAWLNDANYATVANGGNTDWGGTSFMTDIVDCSSNTRTFRMINSDGSRTLFYGASFTITKLNAAISTSTTADNLGDHTATKNVVLNGNYVSNDGGNEGIRIDNAGKVGIGTATPSVTLDVNGATSASTLSLTNSTTSPSLTLRNGDAAATYNDNAQIRFGWAGSTAGTSQYAQLIHTRHNAGSTNNAIDFYLSNGTANNTINSGSTLAMSITSPGNVGIGVANPTQALDVSGNINTSGNYTYSDGSSTAKKIAGLYSAGTFVIMDNIKVSFTSSGNRGLSLGAVSSNFTADISGTYGLNGGGGGNATANASITTSPSSSIFNWSFGTQADTATYIIFDRTNNRIYRVIMMVNGSYINNFISIERLF